MSEYSKIQKRIWNSRTFHHLSEDAKFLWFYILTCPHSNMLGLYVLKPGYVHEDLGWSNQRFSKSFNELLNIQLSNGCQGLIKYDSDNNLILIKNFLEHNPLQNPNQVTAAIKKIRDLPISPLFKDLKLFIEQLQQPFIEPVTVTVAETVSVTVAEAEEKTVSKTVCPHNSIITKWNEILVPIGLPKIRSWGKSRKQHIAARWREEEKRQNIEWWERLFQYIRDGNPKTGKQNSFLLGKVEPKPGKKRFFLTLPWLISSEENLSKVQEGFYEDD